MCRPIALLLLAVFAATSLAVAEEQQSQPSAESAASTKATPVDKKPTAPATAAARAKPNKENPDEVDWSKVDWRKRLTRMQYYIMRQAGTEAAFQNKFWDFFAPGQYRCAGCGLPLFESDSKFESDCGWPSFDKTVAKDAVTQHVDYKIGYPRTEIRCRRCQSHLGHVFNDGPTNTGVRYCMNSAAMKFVNTKQLEAEKKVDKKPASDKRKVAPKASATVPAGETDAAEQ